MRKILLSFILLLFFTSSFASLNKSSNNFVGCNNDINEKYLTNSSIVGINKIEIDTHKYKQWIVNNIKIITSGTRFISDKLRKRFDSTIVITYDDSSKCVFSGRVRQSGDAKDHIALKGNSIIQSLDIHLDNGNIRGITKFKLFKPDSRGVVDDVIIQTELLRVFGYLAPRSIKVKVRVNETESVMLFQEKAAKELLEYNKRREGPILEGDQKFFFKLVENIPQNNLSNWSVGTPILRNKSIKTMLAKQTNANLIHRSETHKKISYEALNNLNLIYLYYGNRFQDEKNNFYFFDYDLDNTLLAFFDKKNILKLDAYNLLMQSTNSQHALSASNRKFYWNTIENYFEPINYDANPDINRVSPTTTTALYRFPISENYIDAFAVLEKKLNNMNVINFHKNMLISGLEISPENLNKKLNKINLNLKKIKNNFITMNNKDLLDHNKFKPIKKVLDNFNKTLADIDNSVFLVKYESTKNMQRCKIYLSQCEDYLFSDKNLTDLLEGELKINNYTYQFLGKNFNFENMVKYKGYNKKKFKNATIYYDDGINIKIDNNNINIIQTKLGSKIFIKNGELIDTKIYFKALEKNNLAAVPINFPIDENGLTGCLSIINSKVKNISLDIDGSNCEDAVNFINAKGNINYINIKNSYSDALDVDFSNLQIKDVNINYAKNDCADFSGGNYKIENLILKNCGDKAISIGEKSNVILERISSEYANIGIASKDSSTVKVNTALFNNIDICLSAYKKKQEFNGGFIEINSMKCDNYIKKTEVDFNSKILEKNIVTIN